MDLDTKIKKLRGIYNRSEDQEVSMFILKELDKLQRHRFKLYGKFLSYNNKLFTYSQLDQSWSSWLA